MSHSKSKALADPNTRAPATAVLAFLISEWTHQLISDPSSLYAHLYRLQYEQNSLAQA